MNRWIPVLGFALLLPLSGAQAATPAELTKSKNCMLCHSVDKKVVGPAFKDVAAKYKGDKTAAGKLATKIKNGGSGVWGGAMPPNPVTEAEAKQLAEWVLAQK